MLRKKIDIREGFLFPWHFMFLAGLLMVVAVPLLRQQPVISLGLIAAALFILTAYEGIDVDKSGKTYRQYRSFFFFKVGKRVRYSGIEKLFITASRMSQRLYSAHTGQSALIHGHEFNGYMKLEDGTRIHLSSKRNKRRLLAVMNKLSAFLDVPLEDHAGEPVVR